MTQINFPEMSLGRQIRTCLGRQFETPPGCQIGMSMGQWIETPRGSSNRIFRGHPGDLGGGISSGHLGDQYFLAGFNTLSNIIVANENGNFYPLEIHAKSAHLTF